MRTPTHAVHKVVAGNVKTTNTHYHRLESDRSIAVCPILLISISRFDIAQLWTVVRLISRFRIEADGEVDDLTCWYVAHLDGLAARRSSEMTIFDVERAKRVEVSATSRIREQESSHSEAEDGTRFPIPNGDRSTPFPLWTTRVPTAIFETRHSAPPSGEYRANIGRFGAEVQGYLNVARWNLVLSYVISYLKYRETFMRNRLRTINA